MTGKSALSGEAPDRDGEIAALHEAAGSSGASDPYFDVAPSLEGAPDRDGAVARIAADIEDVDFGDSGHDGWINPPETIAAALYDAGLRAPSLEGARHPEAGERE